MDIHIHDDVVAIHWFAPNFCVYRILVFNGSELYKYGNRDQIVSAFQNAIPESLPLFNDEYALLNITLNKRMTLHMFKAYNDIYNVCLWISNHTDFTYDYIIDNVMKQNTVVAVGYVMSIFNYYVKERNNVPYNICKWLKVAQSLTL